MNTKDQLTIGEAASRTGLTPRALRLYEKMGLLQPSRGANNYRVYTEQDMQKAMIIHQLRQGGLSLETIRALFAIKQGGLPPAERLAAAHDLLTTIRQDLQAKSQQMAAALAFVEGQLASIHDYLVSIQKGAAQE